MNMLKIKQFSGFTLLEILVALVIMSVGLLGMAGLQIKGLKTNKTAYLRSQATILAYDMADRIRSNKLAVEEKIVASRLEGVLNQNCLSNVGCDSKTMLQNDIALWEQKINEVLNEAQGVVCIDSTPNDGSADSPDCNNVGDAYAIKIWWSEATDKDNDNTRFVVSFIP